jgi:hypothetical protein
MFVEALLISYLTRVGSKKIEEIQLKVKPFSMFKLLKKQYMPHVYL